MCPRKTSADGIHTPRVNYNYHEWTFFVPIMTNAGREARSIANEITGSVRASPMSHIKVELNISDKASICDSIVHTHTLVTSHVCSTILKQFFQFLIDHALRYFYLEYSF